MRKLTNYDLVRIRELKQRIPSDDTMDEIWYEAAAVALNNKIATGEEVELPNDPDAIKEELDKIIDEYGD